MKKAPKISETSLRSDLESKYKSLVERAYNLRQTDDSLSDILYFEAEKIWRKLHSKKESVSAV
jgi:hypothetical protein